jgi:hypothetical protein
MGMTGPDVPPKKTLAFARVSAGAPWWLTISEGEDSEAMPVERVIEE